MDEEARKKREASERRIRAFLDALPEPTPELLAKLDEYGDWIDPQMNPRLSDVEPDPDSPPST